MEELSYEHRYGCSYYRLDWRSYLFGAWHCHDYHKRSRKPTGHFKQSCAEHVAHSDRYCLPELSIGVMDKNLVMAGRLPL